MNHAVQPGAQCQATIFHNSPPLVWLNYPANFCFPHSPASLRGGGGGPLPETPSNKSSRLLLAALSLGFPHSKMLLALCLTISPSFNKKKTCHSKLSQLLHLLKTDRHQDIELVEVMNLLFFFSNDCSLVVNGFIADFPLCVCCGNYTALTVKAPRQTHGQMTTTHET